MAIKKWLVTAEVNMCANHYESVVVDANTERKARMKGEELLLKTHFFVTNMTCKLLEGSDK